MNSKTIMQSDYHVHSSFSGDCNYNMESIIEYAINKNICNLCFTDHYDIGLLTDGINFEADLSKYIPTFIELKKRYENQINLLLGIEIGIEPRHYNKLSEITSLHPFDFIICSNHLAYGMDPYEQIFFQGKSKKQAYEEYWESIIENAKSYTNYDVLGHLDYHIRYGPYEDKTYIYHEFQEILDALLKIIIESGKGIEMNTSGFRYGLNNPHPTLEVIQRYKELGGEIITIGSDAHRPEDLCKDFGLAEEVLKKAGFHYFTIFKERKPEFIKL